MIDCTHKTIFGRPACRFEPRYDRTSPEAMPKVSLSDPFGLPAVIESFKSQTYIRDVCIRCGRTIERQEKPQ